MALNYDTLIAYIDGLNADGSLNEQDYTNITNYILANGDLETSPRDLIQIRRGNYADLPNFAQGELGFTLDQGNLYVGGLSGNVKIPSMNDFVSGGEIEFLRNKNVLVVGDSISDESVNSPNWVTLFRNKIVDIGGTVTNISFSGSYLSGVGGMAELLGTTTGDFDHIIFHVGTNDCTGQLPVGSYSDSTYATFSGALEYIFSTIENKWFNAKVHYITPLKTDFGNETYDRKISLNVYRSVIVSKCNKFGWNIIDGTCSAPNLNPLNALNKATYMTDGLHPDSTYAPIFLDFCINRMKQFGNNIGYLENIYQYSTFLDANVSGTFDVITNSQGFVTIELALTTLNSFTGLATILNIPTVFENPYGLISVVDGGFNSIGLNIESDGDVVVNITTPDTTVIGKVTYRLRCLEKQTISF